MFQKVLRYTGRHRKTTYASILVLVAGVAMSVLPYFFLYRLLRPLLTGGSLTLEETLFNAGAMALCMVLYGLLYVEGLALSHRSAYHTLENLRLHLQSKLEKQPLGAIQEKGVGVWKKMFIDDIESMELLLAHALPEGLSNLAVPRRWSSEMSPSPTGRKRYCMMSLSHWRKTGCWPWWGPLAAVKVR